MCRHVPSAPSTVHAGSSRVTLAVFTVAIASRMTFSPWSNEPTPFSGDASQDSSEPTRGATPEGVRDRIEGAGGIGLRHRARCAVVLAAGRGPLLDRHDRRAERVVCVESGACGSGRRRFPRALTRIAGHRSCPGAAGLAAGPRRAPHPAATQWRRHRPTSPGEREARQSTGRLPHPASMGHEVRRRRRRLRHSLRRPCVPEVPLAHPLRGLRCREHPPHGPCAPLVCRGV